MKSQTKEERRNSFLLIFFILALSCAIAYSNSLHNPFIWDDQALIAKNTLIRSWSNLAKVFTSDLYSGITSGSNFYRPLQTISYMWDYYFWQLDPFGYHLTNLILQILVSFLVFLFSLAMLKELDLAFAVALLFGLNPLHTEAVTYISGRAEMLMGLFLLSSLLLFIRGKRAFSLLAFILGLLSKELAVVFPLVILAYMFYFRDDLSLIGAQVRHCEEGEARLRGEAEANSQPRNTRFLRFARNRLRNPCKARLLRHFVPRNDNYVRNINLIKLVLPFFIIDFVYLILRSGFLHFATIRPPALTKYPLLLRITVLPEIILGYLRLFILPVGLHMSRALRLPTDFLSLFLNWLMLGLLCVACLHILKDKQERRVPAFALFWFLAFLLPQSGILPINAFVSEHFIYLSSISFFMLLAYILRRHLKKSLFFLAVFLLAIFYAMLTFSRNFDWQEELTFYQKILKFSPQSFQAHNNLGLQYELRHLYAAAAQEYKRAIKIEPRLIEAYSNLANVYFKMGKFKAAREEYTKVEKVVPAQKAGELQNNIGCIYEVEGLPEEALARYKLALRLDPSLNFAHFNLARLYATKGKFNLAAEEVAKSLPEISSTVDKNRKYLEIIAAYAKSPKEFQSGVIFYNDLGIQFASQNLLDGALAAFARAVELDPLYADAHFNTGLAYWKKGLKKQAIFEFKRALKINPHHLKAKGFLAEIIYKRPPKNHF